MVARSDQGVSRAAAWVLVVLVALGAGFNAATAKQDTNDLSATGRTLHRQLDDACDFLRRSAVRSPYGWGWPGAIEPRSEKPGSPKPVQPDIDLRVTAAAGLVLELSGQELKSEANHHAAVQAARAMASVLLPTGQVPSTARLVPSPAGHPERAGIVPSREATSAALALMLTVINSTKDRPDERVHSAATRAATWLARQQTAGGGWQSAYPPGTGVKARRLIRLDGPEYRDATYALLLAGHVLGKREYAMAADRCVEQLLRLRIREETSPGAGLWGPAYGLGGEPVRDIDELPYGIDLLASRYATETLFAAQLFAGKKNLNESLDVASKAILGLPKTNGRRKPRYPMFPRNDEPRAPSEETNDISNDADDEKEKPEAPAFDDAALASLLTAVNRAQSIGVEKVTRDLSTDADATERVALTVCHLSEDLLTIQRPQTKRTHGDVPEPVSKAWDLLLKRRAERLATDAAAKK